MNSLIKKNILFAWTKECKKAFQQLKNYVYKVFIFCYFDSSKQCFVEINSSDYINTSVLLQMDDNDVLHLIAYFSKKMALAECHYEIYNKELLAIIWYFEEWRSKFKSTGLLVKVLTDHKGLEYFMSSKKLTPRQVRWAKFLFEFNFVISYQTGKKNDKAHALTRKLNKQPTNDKNEQRKYSICVLLLSSCIKQPIEI